MAPRANLLLLLFVFLLHDVLGGDQSTEQVEKISQENQQLQLIPTACEPWLQKKNLSGTNFLSAEGKHFYSNITIVIWSEARDWCAERGMEMATLKTRSQIRAVAKELKEREGINNYWLGASDVGQTIGQFRWEDGTLVDGTTWLKGIIYKRHGDWSVETCVFFCTYSARLSDVRCSHYLNRILCQVPSALAACL